MGGVQNRVQNSDDEPFRAFRDTNSPLNHACHGFTTTAVQTKFAECTTKLDTKSG